MITRQKKSHPSFISFWFCIRYSSKIILNSENILKSDCLVIKAWRSENEKQKTNDASQLHASPITHPFQSKFRYFSSNQLGANFSGPKGSKIPDNKIKSVLKTNLIDKFSYICIINYFLDIRIFFNDFN